MAELSKGRLRKRKEGLKEALVGNVEEHHKRMIRTSLGHIQAMEEILFTVEQKIQENIESQDPTADVSCTISGAVYPWTDGYFANTVGKHGNEHMIRNYVKQQGTDYHKLHEDRQLTFF